MGDTNGSVGPGPGPESIPSLENAIPICQLASPTQSTLETSGPYQPRTPRMKSQVWTHFVKLVINGEQKAKCLNCFRIFSGNSRNGTSHLKEHMTNRCPRRFGQSVARQKLFTFNRKQGVSMKVENPSSGCLDGGVVDNVFSGHDPKVVIGSPVSVDGASQCLEQECSSLRSLVMKATYKEDTVRFELSLTSSFDQLEKEVARNFRILLGRFKVKYQDEDKEWMLMTMDSHLSYVVSLAKSSGSNVVRLLVSDV